MTQPVALGRFPTSLPSYPAVHDSLECLKLVLLKLRDVLAQDLHQVVRVRLQLLVLLVADVDGGLAPRTSGRHLLVVAALVLRRRAVLGLLLFLAAAFLAVSIVHPVVREGDKNKKRRRSGELMRDGGHTFLFCFFSTILFECHLGKRSKWKMMLYGGEKGFFGYTLSCTGSMRFFVLCFKVFGCITDSQSNQNDFIRKLNACTLVLWLVATVAPACE